MDPLNPLEAEALEILYQINFMLDQRKFSRSEFMRVRGQLRDTITHLENKQFGCATGKHASACFCQP